MNPKDFISKMQDFIKGLLDKQNLNGWVYEGDSNVAFGSPGGHWDPEKFQGYLFVKGDKSFVLRPFVDANRPYIVFESVHNNAQAVNYRLNNKTFQSVGDKVDLLENFGMTARIPRKRQEVKEAMEKCGFNKEGVITSFSESNPDFNSIIPQLLDWTLIREDARDLLRNSEDKQNTEFKNIISRLKDEFKLQDSVLKNFSVIKSYRTWAWIADATGIIGDSIAHYEIVDLGKELSIDLHFEGKKPQKDIFQQSLKELPEGLEWLTWSKSKSIRSSKKISKDSESIIAELCEGLLYIDEAIGDEVRGIIISKKMDGTGIMHDSKNVKPLLNQILYGPPGTGKTYHSIIKAVEIASPDFSLEEGWDAIKKEFDRLIDDKQVVFTTFHQSMTYEDFVEGIKPIEPKQEGGQVTYSVEDGIFKKICKNANPIFGNFDSVIEMFKNEVSEEDGKSPLTIKAKGTTFDVKYKGTSVFYVQPHASIKEKPWYPVNISHIEKAFLTGNYESVYNPTYVREIINYLVNKRGLKTGLKNEGNKANYVLIIDEINRGNISAIFGELITLIEDSKRVGGNETIRVTLPYSKTSFSVPENLFIIGTMNTADRSVEALDTALRRRFSFIEMPPNSKLIAEEGNKVDKIVIKDYSVDLTVLLDKINERIEVLLDKDHLIGHSFFMKVKDILGLKKALSEEIIPLLQEYFFGDYGKITLVLGEGFCVGSKVGQGGKDLFAYANEYDSGVYLEKTIYKLSDPLKMEDPEFRQAIKTLLKE